MKNWIIVNRSGRFTCSGINTQTLRLYSNARILQGYAAGNKLEYATFAPAVKDMEFGRNILLADGRPLIYEYQLKTCQLTGELEGDELLMLDTDEDVQKLVEKFCGLKKS